MSDDLQRRLARTDLNLLPMLLVLMETRSTKATADRIGRTQSAVSHALNRLRAILGDPLFVRHGPKLNPTPLVLELENPLRQLLGDAANFVERGAIFDPAQSDREIVIGCFDLGTPLAEQICNAMRKQGPGLRFRITDVRASNDRLRSGEIDLIISLYRNKAAPGQKLSFIKTVEWAFFAAKSLNLPAKPTPEDWATHPHVQVHTGVWGRTPVDDAARLAGVNRRVALQVNSFMQALFVASRGEMLFTTFPDLMRPVSDQFGLQSYPLPFDMAPAPLSLLTRDTKHDPFSDWLHTTAWAVLTQPAQVQ